MARTVADRGGVGFTPPAAWPDRPKQIWKVQVGDGHASPIVAAGRVFLFSRTGEQEAVSARDLATGKEIWHAAYDAPYQMNSAATAHGKGPKSTPALRSRPASYVWHRRHRSRRGRLRTDGCCGAETSRKTFRRPRLTSASRCRRSSSGDLVIVHAGGIGNGALLALDVASGATKWSWKGDGPAYASPIVAELRRNAHRSSRSRSGTSSACRSPMAGCCGRSRSPPITSRTASRRSSSTICSSTAASTSRRLPCESASPAGKWQISPVWQNADLPMYMSTPVESGGYLFGLTHHSRGQFFCLDLRTGKTMWTTKGREGRECGARDGRRIGHGDDDRRRARDLAQ